MSEAPESADADDPSPSLLVILLVVALLAGGLRFGTLAMVFPPRLTGDELYYVDTALHQARGDGHYSKIYRSWAGWPPGHAFALSLVVDEPNANYRDLPESTLRRFLLFESAVATGTAVLVALLGWSLLGRRTSIAAGLLAAGYPTLIAYGHYLWSENLFVFLEAAALVAAARAAATGRWGWVVAAGVGFGTATLTREVGGLLAGAVALWWCWTGIPAWDASRPLEARRRPAAARSLVLLACTIAVVAPWTARNQQRFDRLVPVSTVGWMGLREGNTLGPAWLRPDLKALEAFRARYFRIPDELERMDLARREARSLVRSEQPAWIFKKLVRNTALFFGPDSFLFKKISRGAYGILPLGPVRGVLVLTMGIYLLVLVGAILGIGLAWTRRRELLPLLATLVVFGAHLVANASSRYRLPLVPLALVFAAYAATHWRELRSVPTGVRVAWAVAIAALVIWPLVYFAPDASSLWSQGTYVIPWRP